MFLILKKNWFYIFSQESQSSSLDPVLRPESSQLTDYEKDSDIEVDLDLPDWKRHISDDILDSLDPRDRKRQDTINGKFL